jgi:hypothetical protein
MNHLWVSSVLNIILFFKPLHSIHVSKMVAKRQSRTLKEMMNVMLISFGLPQNFWGEAVLFVNYILNKLPQKKTNEIPYESWKCRMPS